MEFGEYPMRAPNNFDLFLFRTHHANKDLFLDGPSLKILAPLPGFDVTALDVRAVRCPVLRLRTARLYFLRACGHCFLFRRRLQVCDILERWGFMRTG